MCNEQTRPFKCRRRKRFTKFINRYTCPYMQINIVFGRTKSYHAFLSGNFTFYASLREHVNSNPPTPLPVFKRLTYSELSDDSKKWGGRGYIYAPKSVHFVCSLTSERVRSCDIHICNRRIDTTVIHINPSAMNKRSFNPIHLQLEGAATLKIMRITEITPVTSV